MDYKIGDYVQNDQGDIFCITQLPSDERNLIATCVKLISTDLLRFSGIGSTIFLDPDYDWNRIKYIDSPLYKALNNSEDSDED